MTERNMYIKDIAQTLQSSMNAKNNTSAKYDEVMKRNKQNYVTQMENFVDFAVRYKKAADSFREGAEFTEMIETINDAINTTERLADVVFSAKKLVKLTPYEDTNQIGSRDIKDFYSRLDDIVKGEDYLQKNIDTKRK